MNAQETQQSIDAALTFGILWLDVCRNTQPANVLVEGLKLFVPNGTSALARERMVNLNRDVAKWSLLELDERHDALVEIDCADRGNVSTRLIHAADEVAARARFNESIARVREILPNCEVSVLSAAEIAFRWRGLEFARARLGGIQDHFAARRRSCSAWVRRNEFSRTGTKPNLLNWRTLYAMCATPTVRGNIRCGDFVPKDGWSPWLWAT